MKCRRRIEFESWFGQWGGAHCCLRVITITGKRSCNAEDYQIQQVKESLKLQSLAEDQKQPNNKCVLLLGQSFVYISKVVFSNSQQPHTNCGNCENE